MPPTFERGVTQGPLESPFAGSGGADPIVPLTDAAALLPQVESAEALPLAGKRAVVIGTSRGIGAEVAVSLASAGADIIGSHVDPGKTKKQDGTASRVIEHGSTFTSALGDITTKEGREAIKDAAIGNPENSQGVDILILNAAGGLEKNKPETWATDINVDSQHALIDLFLPHMNEGGKIIFLTSLWAHRYGELVQLPAYGPVASSKNQFEREARERIPELQEHGVDIGFVVGHVISGTSAHTLFTRGAAEEMEKLEKMAEGEKFPEATEMGNAVKDLIVNGFTSGETMYVGGQTAEENTIPRELNRKDIRLLLPMYGPSKLLIDTFERTGTATGRATFTVRETDTEGHFGGPFHDLELFRGVDQIESSAQALGLTVLTNEGDTRALGVFRGVRGPIHFDNPLRPGMTAEIFTEVTVRHREGFVGNAEMRVGDTTVSKVNGIDIALVPNEKMARTLLAQKFARYDKKTEDSE